MIKLLFILIIVLTASPIFSQNLVRNYNFNDAWTCPQHFTTQPVRELVPHWLNPNRGTPDHFHVCSDSISGIPDNFAGYMYPFDGRAYAGIILREVFDSTHRNVQGISREYIQTELTKPLMRNKLYCISLYYAHASKSVYAVDALGVALTRDRIRTRDAGKIIQMPQVINRPGHIMQNKTNWNHLCGVYRARGNEKYLTIGNFLNNSQTRFVKNTDDDVDSLFIYAYYYIDAVRVFEIENHFECGCSEIDSFGMDMMADNYDPETGYNSLNYTNRYLAEHQKSKEDMLADGSGLQNNLDSDDGYETFASHGIYDDSDGRSDSDKDSGLGSGLDSDADSDSDSDSDSFQLDGDEKDSLLAKNQNDDSGSGTSSDSDANGSLSGSGTDLTDDGSKIAKLDGSSMDNDDDGTDLSQIKEDGDSLAYSDGDLADRISEKDYNNGLSEDGSMRNDYSDLSQNGKEQDGEFDETALLTDENLYGEHGITSDTDFFNEKGFYDLFGHLESTITDDAFSAANIGDSFRLNRIFFEFNSSELLTASHVELDKLVEILKQMRGLRIEINGHTDNVGSNAYNRRLSVRRADSVYEYLKENGIDSNRMSTNGFGSREPVADNETSEGRAKNRRVEIVIIDL